MAVIRRAMPPRGAAAAALPVPAGREDAERGDDVHAIAPFSMIDEETDIDRFRQYLQTLSPDALWDVRSHIDEDRYPRRFEATLREIARRRLMYVTPYTPQEAWLRGMFGWCFLFAVLAAVLRGIGSYKIDLFPGERLPFFYDLAVGGPKAALMVLPLERAVAFVGEIAVGVGVGIAVARWLRRRLRADVLVTGLLALTFGGLLLMLACR